MNTDNQQPIGEAIEEARKAMRPKLSGREAAKRAGLSEGRWRQIVKGYQATGGGRIPVIGPPETVARMAQVVGLHPDAVEAAGRADAANEMRRAEAEYPNNPTHAAKALDVQSMWAELESYMAAGDDAWPDSPPTSALGLWTGEQLAETLMSRVVGYEEHTRSLMKTIIIRGEAIDTLRRRLGLPPIYSHMSSSGHITTEAVLRAAGLAEDDLEGGDGNADESRDQGGPAPMKRDDYELIAHAEERAIEEEQGHDEHP